VDAHAHFWDPARFTYAWLAGAPALGRAFLPADFAAAAPDVDGLVFVQAECAEHESVAEAEWVGELARGEPRIHAIVARAALERGDAARAEVERLAALRLVTGVRRNIQGEPRGFASAPDFVRGVRLLAELDLSFDLCVTHDQLAEAAALARACPTVRFVLDHCGKPPVRTGGLDPWRADLARLAELPNTWCKVSGLATEADPARWTAADLSPYVDHVVQCFGPARLMYGGDWPVLTIAGGYAPWRAAVDELFAGATVDERAAVYGGVARAFYRIGAEQGGAADRRPGAGAPAVDPRLLRLAPADNVLVATVALASGTAVGGVRIVTDVPLGHKVAARAIAPGERILKWGAPIGSATAAIAPGEHVHLHNMTSDYLPTYTLDKERSYVE
jgi:L-fuconolactonase